MCMYSVIADHYHDKWQPRPWYPEPHPSPPPYSPFVPNITRDEFDNLRKEVVEMKELLKKAKKYDDKTNQSDCEKPELVAILKRIAKAVGVSIDDFPEEGLSPDAAASTHV